MDDDEQRRGRRRDEGAKAHRRTREMERLSVREIGGPSMSGCQLRGCSNLSDRGG